MDDLIALEAGALRAVVAPAAGGSLAGFYHGTRPITRETPPEALAARAARQTACYPLVPYSNRIAAGRFHFGGTDYQLAHNFDGAPYSIHGNAWQRPWQVSSAGIDACRLTLEHRPDRDGAEGWPFAYDAEEAFSLAPEALRISLRLVNRDTRPMPAGFGLHPFFPRPSARLTFSADSVWLKGADLLPSGKVAIPPGWQHAQGRDVGSAILDNAFAGWRGPAEIRYGNGAPTVTISADPVFGFLHVFVPEGRDVFAVEPVSHMADAVNRLDQVPDHGLRILEPGAEMAGTVTFQIGAA